MELSPREQELPANRGAAALWQSLKKLHTRASLIMVTAHPDDEDGGMLAYESRGQGTRVALLTHDRVLYDVVRVVRMVRPLVVTSVFVGGPSDGHGNHQTAGAMAQEVFKAAADPNVFPDQIKAGLRPWAPLKDYARVPFMRRRGGESLPANVEIPE